jgi:hypothetical protein
MIDGLLCQLPEWRLIRLEAKWQSAWDAALSHLWIIT